MSEPNPRSKRTRANVSVMPKDGGVYDLPHVIEADGREDGFAAVNDVETPIPVPMGEDAASPIDPAIQGNDFPVDSYTSKPVKDFPLL